MTDSSYVLGTHEEEVERLGLQHRVWRPRMLEAWRRAGVTVGSRVLDVGAGPGYAAADLAEIVGPTGEVVAVERSARFIQAMRGLLERRGLKNVSTHEIDLMDDPLPASEFDVAWCRWVASFVSSPERLVNSIREALKVGGRVVFHEYVDYKTWRLAPRRKLVEAFVAEVMASWRASGGEPDISLVLPGLLTAAGFRIIHAEPMVFAVHPSDYIWQWLASFVNINLERLVELKRVEARWADEVRAEWAAAEGEPTSILLTPMVLEIVGEKMA